MTGLQKLWWWDGPTTWALLCYKWASQHLCPLGAQNQPATYSLCLHIPLSCSLKGTAKWLLAKSISDTLSAAQDRQLICCFCSYQQLLLLILLRKALPGVLPWVCRGETNGFGEGEDTPLHLVLKKQWKNISRKKQWKWALRQRQDLMQQRPRE